MDTINAQLGQEIEEYQNKYFMVYKQEVDFGAFKKEYYVSRKGDKAGLLIVHKDSVLLARQYRLMINRFSWEVPGGKVEEGESPADAAVRECEEETGLRGLNPKALMEYPQGLDSVRCVMKLFFATEFEKKREFVPDPSEVDRIQWFPIDDCLKMIKDGEIKDHCTIIAVLYYRQMQSTGRKT